MLLTLDCINILLTLTVSKTGMMYVFFIVL